MYTVSEVCNQISVDILCGKYDEVKMLPTERALAEQYGVGRPTIHAALVRLQGQGLIKTIPRHGWEIMDLKRHGKLDLMTLALSMPMEDISLSFAQDALSLFIASTKDMVEKIVDSGFNDFEITDFLTMIQTDGDADGFAESVFQFYQRLAMRSENSVYSLMMNQFKDGIVNTANLADQVAMIQYKEQVRLMLEYMSRGKKLEAAETNQKVAIYLFKLWANRKGNL